MNYRSGDLRAMLFLLALTGVMASQFSCNTTSVDPADNGDSGNSADDSELTLDEDGRPVGWSEQTHSKSATADYSVVFPDDMVNRLDITISADDWLAMQENMTELYGEQNGGGQMPGGGGAGGWAPGDPGDLNSNGGMMPDAAGMPADMLNACEGLDEGDECAVSLGGAEITGTCEPLQGEQLVCQPGGQGGMQPGGGMPGDVFPGDEIPSGTAPDVNSPPDGMGDANGGIGGWAATENPVFVPCTLEFNGKTWWYVGIRCKGQSTLSSTWSSGIGKLPFRLDFDEFEDDHPEVDNQRFYGFKKLSLANNWSDPSYLREKITHDIFREGGVAAPHTAFYRLYIDYGQGSTYFGLYAMTEIPDDPMLEDQFGSDSGNLYKPTSNWGAFAEEDFDKESNEDEEDWSDVEAAIDALHADRTDAAQWRAGLEAVMDVDAFLHWLAVNTVIQNWDTYGNMAQNYYLYGDPDEDGRLVWIPWDNNMALSSSGELMGRNPSSDSELASPEIEAETDVEDRPDDPDRGVAGQSALSLSLDEVSDDWPLIRYLADDPVYWETYVSYVQDTIEGAFDVETTQARYQAAHDLIRPYVVGEQGEQEGYTFISDSQEFDEALQTLFSHVEERREAVLEFLEDTP